MRVPLSAQGIRPIFAPVSFCSCAAKLAARFAPLRGQLPSVTDRSTLIGSLISCQRPIRSMKQSGAVMMFSGVRSPRPAMLDCPTSKNERMSCAASCRPSLIHNAITKRLLRVFYLSIAQKQPTFTNGCFYAVKMMKKEKTKQKVLEGIPFLHSSVAIGACRLHDAEFLWLQDITFLPAVPVQIWHSS